MSLFSSNCPASLFDAQKLRRWFFLNRRFLPWRESSSPYEVWVSEVMLQQTQVTVVIPYFNRWMRLFPTISALAAAPIEAVIKAWEGLGYYARARHLKEGAIYLTRHFGGELPDSYEALEKVKGLGPYTIGAILSFAFKKKAAAVDGNVLRVLSRFFSISKPIDQQKTQKEIRDLCLTLLPEVEPWVVMEALIELGALVCQKKAHCDACPLSERCLGKSQAHLLPIRKARQKSIELHRDVAIIYAQDEILLRKGEPGGVMADLWEFPYFEKGLPVEKALNMVSLVLKGTLREFHHQFTKYKAFLYPSIYQGTKVSVSGYHWIPFNRVHALPFSSGHRQIVYALQDRMIPHWRPFV